MMSKREVLIDVTSVHVTIDVVNVDEVMDLCARLGEIGADGGVKEMTAFYDTETSFMQCVVIPLPGADRNKVAEEISRVIGAFGAECEWKLSCCIE